jgi:hypothetical protein
MKDILELLMPGIGRDGGAGVCVDTCWIEVELDGEIGPDFGWPPEADKLACLGPCPLSDENWVTVVTEWLQAGRAGEGDGVTWARGYLHAHEVAELLDCVLPADPGSGALKVRLSERNRYIVFAQFRRWSADDGDDDDDTTAAPEPPTPVCGSPIRGLGV